MNKSSNHLKNKQFFSLLSFLEKKSNRVYFSQNLAEIKKLKVPDSNFWLLALVQSLQTNLLPLPCNFSKRFGCSK